MTKTLNQNIFSEKNHNQYQQTSQSNSLNTKKIITYGNPGHELRQHKYLACLDWLMESQAFFSLLFLRDIFPSSKCPFQLATITAF